MKAVVAVLLLAMAVCAMCQVAPVYNYGYNTYTPGARVSHYASSGYAAAPAVAAAPHYAYNYAYGAYPYRFY